MRTSNNAFLFLALVILFHACTTDNSNNGNDYGYLHGVFITNEGAYGNSNGSVSFLKQDSSKAINHLFELVNGRPLGDVVQSIGIAGEKGFIVVNNSQKVEVVDLKTFESIGVMSGIEYPRYFLAINDQKGYLTDGNFTGRVLVIDIDKLQIIDTIACGSGPEHLIRYENSVIVANSGGWGNDSTLTVIDSRTDKVTGTWRTGYNPTDMVLDRNSDLWILCKGKVVWEGWNLAEETVSSICVVNPKNGTQRKELEIGATADYFWPQAIGIDQLGKHVYYLEADGIHSINYQSDNTIGSLSIPGIFYGFGIEPSTDQIFCLKAPSFTAAGWLIRYQTDGIVLDSIQVGIGPNRVVFN